MSLNIKMEQLKEAQGRDRKVNSEKFHLKKCSEYLIKIDLFTFCHKSSNKRLSHKTLNHEVYGISL